MEINDIAKIINQRFASALNCTYLGLRYSFGTKTIYKNYSDNDLNMRKLLSLLL